MSFREGIEGGETGLEVEFLQGEVEICGPLLLALDHA